MLHRSSPVPAWKPVSQRSTPSKVYSTLTTGSRAERGRNAGILVVVVFCLVVFFFPSAREVADAESAPPTPYTVKNSYLRSGSGWVVDQARVMGGRMRVPFSRHHSSLSNSRPHPVTHYPEFQERMYKLTAQDWPSYERTLLEFSRRALPKQMAAWASNMVRSRSPSRMALRAHVGTSIPGQIWQTGKEIPQTRNSFQEKNPRASYNFYDDALLESWSEEHFVGSLVKKTWDGMERIVLKADFWRYLVTFLEGGYYSGTW